MTTVTCSNGVKLDWDNSLRVGDLITSYHKGFHKITNIVPRKHNTPLIEYTRVYDAKGKKSSKQESCDASYCRRAEISLNCQIAEKEEEIKRFKEILKSL